jgi:hypothetical protein
VSVRNARIGACLLPILAACSMAGPSRTAVLDAGLEEVRASLVPRPAPIESAATARGRVRMEDGAGASAAFVAVAEAVPTAHGTKAAAAAAARARTAVALATLDAHVTRASDPGALRTALQAYFNYRSAQPDQVRKPYLYFVDLGLDNRTARGYVFDMERLTLVDGPFTVAHGRGSARVRDGVPTTFSNRPGSNMSSLGLYLAQETYAFHGKAGGRAYRSVGLRMRGESGAFNSAARARGIVAHGAPYVTRSAAGRSEGCPAMEPARAQRLLPLIADGGVVFIYSPRDERWLDGDPWVNPE